jgi:dihydroflavonol-4-reductase
MPDKQKVLVTGANGLLGANIVWQLGNHEFYSARAMVRKGANMLSLQGANYEMFEGNITIREDIEKALDGCDFVIHCAARTSQHPSGLKHYQKANIDSTKLIVEVCIEKRIKRLVFVSTTNCFTNGSLQSPGNEKGTFMPWLKKSGYAYSKYLAQELVLNAVKKQNFPAVVVAPGFLIGPRDAKPSSGKLILYGMRNRFIFCPPGGKSFVDAEYAAESTINGLTAGSSGDIWLLTGENLRYREFFRLLAKLSDKKKHVLLIPRFLLRAAAIICDGLESIFRITLPFNSTNQKLLCLDNYFSNHKAMKELHMKPTKTFYALLKAMEWFNQKGIITPETGN